MPKFLAFLSRLLNFVERRLRGSLRASSTSGLLPPLRSWTISILLLPAGVLLACVLGVFVLNQHRSRDELQLTQAALERMQSRLQSDTSLVTLARRLHSAIPGAIDTSAALIRIQALSAANNVELLNIAPSKAVENHSQLGVSVHIFDLQLNGTYINLKSFLAQLLVDSPDLWLARLQLQAEGSTVVASVSLHAWSADMKASPQTRPLVTP